MSLSWHVGNIRSLILIYIIHLNICSSTTQNIDLPLYHHSITTTIMSTVHPSNISPVW